MRIVNPIGKKGEDIAYEYLVKKGYIILERNYRKSYGEIDIIATKDNILVFIEVKTRTSNKFGSPLESVTPRKLQSILKTAEYYSMVHQELPKELRIDAISVLLVKGEIVIEHVKNASG